MQCGRDSAYKPQINTQALLKELFASQQIRYVPPAFICICFLPQRRALRKMLNKIINLATKYARADISRYI
ncbi:hypothetical protein Plhal304r1_c042g0121751 [Plasmopara halstedii]